MRASRSAPPFMTPARWVVLSALALILIAVSLNLYYTYIQKDRWDEQTGYERLAKKETDIVKIVSATKFVWNETYWVVRGKDKADATLYAWLAAGKEPVVIRADEAVTAAEIKARLRADKPDASVVRIQPGMLDGREVWEIFYSRKNGGRHYYYSFYDFREGTLVETYTLPAKIAEGTAAG